MKKLAKGIEKVFVLISTYCVMFLGFSLMDQSPKLAILGIIILLLVGLAWFIIGEYSGDEFYLANIKESEYDIQRRVSLS